jgi:phospholipid-binding lipoprotein MlaA
MSAHQMSVTDIPMRDHRSRGATPALQAGAVASALAALSACTAQPQATGINDPFEASNRAIHEFNKSFDSAVLSPTAEFYGETLPAPVRTVIGNVADNISLTGDVVNDILQGQVDDAVHNGFRFAINSTLGLGGLFDPAASFGLETRATGFGETLHTYGVPEGPYVELPFLGPSTGREAAGRVVDFFTNADSYALEGTSAAAATGVGVVDLLNDRYDLRDVIDDVLYGSEDSYALARDTYLQNLRFRYAGDDAAEQVIEIYEELYDDPAFQ